MASGVPTDVPPHPPSPPSHLCHPLTWPSLCLRCSQRSFPRDSTEPHVAVTLSQPHPFLSGSGSAVTPAVVAVLEQPDVSLPGLGLAPRMAKRWGNNPCRPRASSSRSTHTQGSLQPLFFNFFTKPCVPAKQDTVVHPPLPRHRGPRGRPREQVAANPRRTICPSAHDQCEEGGPTRGFVLRPHRPSCWKRRQTLGPCCSQCQEGSMLSNQYRDANDDSQDDNSDGHTDGNQHFLLPSLLLVLQGYLDVFLPTFHIVR